MKYTVYVLQSIIDNRTYVGYTNNLENRIKQHNYGNVKSTKNRKPFIVWYTEEFENRKEALRREKFFKTAWGRKQLEKILGNL